MAYFRAGTARATQEAQQITVAKTPLATFESNVSGLYIPEILAYIQATQAGTGDPSPSNPRAISGVSSVDTTRTGKNLLCSIPQTTTVNGVTFALNSDGSITLSGTATANASVDLGRYETYLKAGNYISNTNGTGYTVNIFKGSTSGTILKNGGGTFTLAESDFIFERVLVTNGTTVNAVIYPQIELGSTATTYQPYTGTTATTALGGTYYGGYVNVTTGLLTVTHALFQLTGSADENYILQGDGTTARRFRLENALSDYSTLIACSHDLIATNNNNVWGYARFVSSYLVLLDNNNTMADQTALKSWLASEHANGRTVSFLMQLATPIEIQLTPAQIEQLLGQNNVFASTGDVAVKYWRID